VLYHMRRMELNEYQSETLANPEQTAPPETPPPGAPM
jgi:hypothetical protein